MQLIRNGKKMDLTCTAAVAMDEVVVVGTIIGIASTAGAIGDVIALDVVGVYELPAKAEAFTQGALLYWDVSEGYLTVTSTDNVLAGIAWEAKGASATTALIKINA